MAVRMGPLEAYEKHIYGHAMPQKNRRHHIEFYERHNAEVMDVFADSPERLLVVCWETGEGVEALPGFVGVDEPIQADVHINRSSPVYGGENLLLAHANRIAFQSYWQIRRKVARRLRA